ncbi:MAG: PQQ-dependent sugar dehydrogenase [Limisphaerales bacterium]
MLFQGWFKRVVCLSASLAAMLSSSAALKVELLVGGLSRPVFVCSPPGDSNRLFIVEQQVSRIRVFDRTAGSLLPTAFLTITGVRRGGEQGLLGLAFHPGFATNGYFFLNLNPSDSPNRTEIRRYRVQGDAMTNNVADATSMTVVLTYPQPESNHNGGWLGFGPDGFLYIASGDGGGSYDQHGSIGNGQDRTTLLGKILRIDVDGAEPYAIPDGNPFKAHMTYANEIWAFGLRNPWRCSFDRETGNLWIGDVGQGAREEIDVNPAGIGGLNFGWRPREGMIATPTINEAPVTPATNPVFDYDRSLGYSVTGGYVYRGTAVPELRGKYIFADYGSDRFWATDLNETGTNGVTTQITTDINPNQTAVNNISSFGEDAAGELYVCDLDGQVFKILAEGPVPPQVTGVNRVGGDFIFSFQARAAQAYAIEESPLLGPGTSWSEVETVAAAQADRTVTVTNSTTGEARFFRIRTE